MGVGRVWALVLFGLVPALAFGPEEALKARPAGEAAWAERIRLVEAARDFRELGLAGELAASYEERLTAELTFRLNLDPAARTEAELRALAARAELRARRREAIRKALLAHAALWRAEAEEKAARARLKLQTLMLQAAEARRAGALELEAEALALEEAELALKVAVAARERAQARVRALGFSPPAEPRVLRFSLPSPAPSQERALRRRLKQQNAEAAYRRLALLQADLSYDAGLSYRLTAESAGPSLAFTVGPENPLLPPGTLSFSLAARIQIDPAAWLAARGEARALAAEEAEAAREEREKDLKLKALKDQAEAAWERLLLTGRRAEIRAQQAALAEQRYRLGLISEIEAARAELSRLEAETARAEAWRGYLEAMAAYLEAADAAWEVAR